MRIFDCKFGIAECGMKNSFRVAARIPSLCNPKSQIRNRQSAFTILEIVMVLAITVLMLGMAMPAMSGMLKGEQLRAPARELEAMAITARCNSLAEQRPYQILITPTGFQLESPTEKSGNRVLGKYTLPAGVTFEVASWPEEKWAPPKERIWYFSPSGICEPIRVMFRKDDSYFSQKYSAITGWDQEESFFIR